MVCDKVGIHLNWLQDIRPGLCVRLSFIMMLFEYFYNNINN